MTMPTHSAATGLVARRSIFLHSGERRLAQRLGRAA